MIGPLLQQSMKQLGIAAVAQATAMAKLASEPDLRAFKDEILEQMLQVTRASIAFTAQLIVACKLGTAEHARALEEKLLASMDGAVDNSPDYQAAVEVLIASARAYANRMVELVDHCLKAGIDPFDLRADGHEQTHRLARAAVTFTLQLTIASGADQEAFRATARTMEKLLIAKLDEVFGLAAKNLS